MASNIYVPFNFAPAAISVKTTSYTIPAGKYSRVVANLEGSATLTINGVTALRGTENTVLASDNLRTFTSAGSSNYLLVGTASSSAGVAAIGGAFNESTSQTTTIADFFCPTGTVISGTGVWRAIVTEYNNIT